MNTRVIDENARVNLKSDIIKKRRKIFEIFGSRKWLQCEKERN